MKNFRRTTRTLLIFAGALALAGIIITLLAPLRNSAIDWRFVCLPLGMIAGITASALNDTQRRARAIFFVVSFALIITSAIFVGLRLLR